MPSKTELLTELCSNFFNAAPDIVAVVISDADGLIIHSQANPDPEQNVAVDDELLAGIVALVEPVLQKLRDQYSFKKFGTATFDAERYRLLNIAAGIWTVTYVVNLLGSVDAVYPYAYIAGEKIFRILDGRDRVQTSVPKLTGLSGTLENLPADAQYTLKFILTGGDAVGKTSIVKKFVEGAFHEDYRATIGLNVLTHSYNFLGYSIKLTIFDLAGQQYFKRVRQGYYEGSSAAFIVFDLTRRNTFEEVKIWKAEMDKHVGLIPFCIIGNKSDLGDQRQVSFEEAVKMAEELGTSYMETSALTGSNVEDAFALIAYKILSMQEDQNRSAPSS
jgi:small GTP-binding protein